MSDSPDTINLVVASRDTATQDRSKDIFDRSNMVIHPAADLLDLGSVDTVAGRLAGLDPHVVLLGPDLGIDESLSLVAELESVCPAASVILVGEPDADLFRDALHAGATDVIAPDADDTTWAFSVDRAIATTQRLLDLNGRSDVIATEQSTAQVITVLSPKGGSGKTTVSTNLAVTLARSHPGDVVLVDLDLQFGDVAHALRVIPEFTLADATSATADSTALKSFLTSRESLYVLCAPQQPEDADDISAEVVRSVLQQLHKSFSIIVVDTPAGLDETTLEAIDQATDLVFVTSTDVPSVRAVQKELDILDRMGVEKPTRHLVMNRSNAKVGLDINDITLTTGLDINAQVPSNRQVPIAMNRGIPIVELDAKSPPARNIIGLADQLAGTTPKKSSMLRGFRR